MSSRRRSSKLFPSLTGNRRAPPQPDDVQRAAQIILEEAIQHEKLLVMGSARIHPVLTDYNARGCMDFIRRTFRYDQDLPPLSPLQQSLKAFADLLIDKQDIIRAADGADNDTTSVKGKGKEPVRKPLKPLNPNAKEFKPDNEASRDEIGEDDVRALFDDSEFFTTPINELIQSRATNAESSSAKLMAALLTRHRDSIRTASFEAHSSSSRVTSRRRSRSSAAHDTSDESTQRRRKTPVEARSMSISQGEISSNSAASVDKQEKPQLTQFEYQQLIPAPILRAKMADRDADHRPVAPISEFKIYQSNSTQSLPHDQSSNTIIAPEDHAINDAMLLDVPSNTVPSPVLWDIGVLEYLSTADVRALRMTCKDFADSLAPWLFRSVVTPFRPKLFNINPSFDKQGYLNVDHKGSMLSKYGDHINKFGISFEYNQLGLAQAPHKHTSKSVDAWFGPYQWPIADYPYFRALKELDALLDDERQILTQTMKNLTKCSELAISVDSGHGWLEGADCSDLALLEERCSDGSKVFGKAFDAPDQSYEESLKWLFRWAQINSSCHEKIHGDSSVQTFDGNNQSISDRMLIRSYDSFRAERIQPDFEPNLHTGGIVTTPVSDRTGPASNNFFTQPPLLQSLRARREMAMSGRRTTAPQPSPAPRKQLPIIPQWPLIFSGHNISAECKSDYAALTELVDIPSKFPLLPNALTEAQAQWLMETSWIQRTFLSTYIEAIRLNAPIFEKVHSLHIAKLSSGLIGSISQRTFWTALPNLRKVTLMIKPDWRVEHRPGDESYDTSMQTAPIECVKLFADLLRNHILNLENLNSLELGYIGGGEHQKGLFGRNQHVLPAPITTDPYAWLAAQNPVKPRPHEDTMFVFPHIRTLTFKNCWFSPLMFEAFMHKSRDTSLYNLVLDSVSLTSKVHSSRTDGPLRTEINRLQCLHAPAAWLNEDVPANASWVTVLDAITPGQTILDMKYETNMIDEHDTHRPSRNFRGNIQHINLKSCGYVAIKGIGSNDLNQNELVLQNLNWCAMDDGLQHRAATFDVWSAPPDKSTATATATATASPEHPLRRRWFDLTNENPNVKPLVARPSMQAGRLAHKRDESLNAESPNTYMTGLLTQCIHPVEKRILECMWGMKFGWGDDMVRWAAVEDGRFMGGTGRFSGEIFRDHTDQVAFNDAVAVSIQNEIYAAEQARSARETPRQQAQDLQYLLAQNEAERHAGATTSSDGEIDAPATSSRGKGTSSNAGATQGSIYARSLQAHLANPVNPRASIPRQLSSTGIFGPYDTTNDDYGDVDDDDEDEDDEDDDSDNGDNDDDEEDDNFDDGDNDDDEDYIDG